MTTRFLPVRLTIPIAGVSRDWPELLLPQDMDSAAWDRMLALLDVMRVGVVSQGDRLAAQRERRPVLALLATALNQALETKEAAPSSKKVPS